MWENSELYIAFFFFAVVFEVIHKSNRDFSKQEQYRESHPPAHKYSPICPRLPWRWHRRLDSNHTSTRCCRVGPGNHLRELPPHSPVPVQCNRTLHQRRTTQGHPRNWGDAAGGRQRHRHRRAGPGQQSDQTPTSKTGLPIFSIPSRLWVSSEEAGERRQTVEDPDRRLRRRRLLHASLYLVEEIPAPQTEQEREDHARGVQGASEEAHAGSQHWGRQRVPKQLYCVPDPGTVLRVSRMWSRVCLRSVLRGPASTKEMPHLQSNHRQGSGSLQQLMWVFIVIQK